MKKLTPITISDKRVEYGTPDRRGKCYYCKKIRAVTYRREYDVFLERSELCCEECNVVESI